MRVSFMREIRPSGGFQDVLKAFKRGHLKQAHDLAPAVGYNDHGNAGDALDVVQPLHEAVPRLVNPHAAWVLLGKRVYDRSAVRLA